MTHRLQVWADGDRMAVIEHEARDDTWALHYDATWHANPNAYPLSPVLPLGARGHASASVRRFIEHLLPEGRALDVAVAEGAVITQTQSALVLENLIGQFLFNRAAEGSDKPAAAE